MKNLILVAAAMFMMAFVSCGNANETTVGTDSIANDTTMVDTVNTDSTVVVDTVAAVDSVVKE